jgi:hypothetical protein
MVSSGVALRQTTGRLFFNLSIVNVTDLLKNSLGLAKPPSA